MKTNLMIIFHFNNLRKLLFTVFCAFVSFSDQYLQLKKFQTSLTYACLIIYLKICIFHAVENVTEKTTKTEETNFFAKYKMLSIFDCFDFLFVIYTLPAVMVSSN